MNETVDLQRPEEIARLRHYLRTALNQIVGYADIVRRLAEEQGARAEAGFMERAAAAGREAIEVVQHLLPVKSHVSESALPMLRTNLATRAGRISHAITSFESRSRGSCAAEMGKMRLGLRDLEAFARGPVAAPASSFYAPPAANIFQMPAAEESAALLTAGDRALVVGDEALYESLAPLLEDTGLRPVAERDAAAALASLRGQSFQLVFLDLSLPETEIRAIIEAARPNTPVVVLGGAEQRETAVRALQAGAAELLEKPLHPVIFAAHIGALLRRQSDGTDTPAHGLEGFHPLDISETVREIAEQLRGAIGNQVRLRMPLTHGLPAIPANARQIQQLVFNLVVNAGEAIGTGPGTVTVETGLRYLPDGAAAAPPFEALPPGHFVFVSVHDTGCGIDEAVRARIFEPLFSTHATGRGLGLANAREVAIRHGGVVHVDTTNGKGSRFEVLLPVPHADAG